MTKQLLALIVLALMLVGGLPARAALELKEGDSIVVVGNTFAERLAISGYFDAMVHAANPDKKIVIRSVPNSADEVDDMPRETKVPPADFYLKRHGADVVFMCFGMSESFDGLGGVEKFKADLTKQVDLHLGNQYNGESAPKIVLVSPIAHEDLGAPLPTGDAVAERNSVVKAYADAIKEVAEAKGAMYIDLFSADSKPADATLTNNGIAPSEYGCFIYAREMAKQLGWLKEGGDVGPDDAAVAKLRQVAYDKHYHWRHRYRFTNTEYVIGRRHKPFGNVNFPGELKQLDRMVEARESAMWAMKNKPNLLQVFMTPPSGKAIWETTPTTYNYPEDKWTPVKIEVPKTTRAVGDPDNIKPAADYLKTFQVADGYQVNVFASEEQFPELANPLAMTFDAKGRLWVLCSPTYPHPMPGEVTDCKLIILDDTTGDGKADKSTVFARHMNIPTGFVVDANGVAYVGQAPDLWKLTDTDGDDVADRKEIVYSGFGMPDSHHTISALVWDPNGGILMLEGVFTRTNVETPYGTKRTRDAAIWRFDPRTHKLAAIGHTGHPNPWGQTFDEYGASILMDTSGANQYNFNSLISPYIFPDKPRKGPPVVKRGRPTAGCEIIYSRHFPDDVQGTYVHSQCIGFLGTNWDRLLADGSKSSGYTSTPMPKPILSSPEGNYRPVCSELGADGALYIADWVNPLIGHMQFNLRDPRRDHSHGRIFRVTHKERPLVDRVDLTKLDTKGLLEQLKVPEQNTRDRARRILQNQDPATVAKVAGDWLMDQNPRDPMYDRLALEVLWIQQGVGMIDTKIIDEVMRGREAQARAGAMRAVRYALEFDEMTTAQAKPFIIQAVTDRDMRVRLEAVMACAFLDSADAGDIANRVTNQDMDAAIRTAHQQTIKVLKAKGITTVAGLPEKYALPADALLAELKKKDVDPLIPMAALAREDLPLDARRLALQLGAQTPELRGRLLIQTANNTIFDPARTAQAITPLLLELPDEAVFAISKQLNALMDNSEPALRSGALALKVRAGTPLPGLAARDPVALLDAVATLPSDQVPDSVPGELMDLAEAGQVDAPLAFGQAVRLSSDKASLFKRLANPIDKTRDIGFDQWSDQHRLAMSALGAMHIVPDDQWPKGFNRYRLERADEAFLAKGHEVYHHEEKGCVKCHGKHGEGSPGFPPLAGSPTILGDPMRPATIVKYGLIGELPHAINPADDKPFSAQMEALSYLSDADMAAAITYVRQSWGNYASPVSPKQVADAPKPLENAGQWGSEGLFEKYPFERDRVLGSLPAPKIEIKGWKPPKVGVLLMLLSVTVPLGAILIVTWLGGVVSASVPDTTPVLA